MKNIPAFPMFPENGMEDKDGSYGNWNGMTLRDYFAAKAMSAYCSNQLGLEIMERIALQEKKKVVDKIAEHSYSFADAMLKEREK